MVINHDEADVVRRIFEMYINGASLKDVADELTRLQTPYTEKTCVWDKARIARIIENPKYIGCRDYDPIVDEDIYTEAVLTKSARQRNAVPKECAGIALIRNRVKCGQCNSPMVRRVNSKRHVKESWKCTNPECGCYLRISDGDLLTKINLLLNRIIENSEFRASKPKKHFVDSPEILKLQHEIDVEMCQECPSEDFIIAKVSAIATQLYAETNSQKMIASRIAKKRALLMTPQETFNCENFSALIDAVKIGVNGNVVLMTKTNAIISEGDDDDGGT